MSASLAGVLFLRPNLSSFLEKHVKLFITFAAGVFLVVTISLFSESLSEGVSLSVLIISAVAGALFLEGASNLIPHAHHHHDVVYPHGHTHADSTRMLLGDAIHNIGDGIILVPAFLADFWIGVGTTIAIFMHELVQEIAEFFVLREAGFSAGKSLFYSFLVSSTLWIGIFIAVIFSSYSSVQAPLLAFAGGGFMYIIFRDLLPSILNSVKINGLYTRFIIAFLLGIIIMGGIKFLTPEETTLDDASGGQKIQLSGDGISQ